MTGGSFIAFLAALPELVRLGREVFEFMKKLSGDDPHGFMVRTTQVFEQLNRAKTDQDYQQVAKELQDLIRKSI